MSAVCTLLRSTGLVTPHLPFGFGSGIIIFGWGPGRRAEGGDAVLHSVGPARTSRDMLVMY
jgi:hypothetical protein